MKSNPFEQAKKDGYFSYNSRKNPTDSEIETLKSYRNWCKDNDKLFIILDEMQKYAYIKIDISKIDIKHKVGFSFEEYVYLITYICRNYKLKNGSLFGYPLWEDGTLSDDSFICTIEKRDAVKLIKYMIDFFGRWNGQKENNI